MKSIKYLAMLFSLLVIPSVFASYSIDGNSTTTNGESFWNSEILRLSANLSGTDLTLTVTKKDSGDFKSSGTVYFKVGSPETFGAVRDETSVYDGLSSRSYTHDLADYLNIAWEDNLTGYPKEFYVRYEGPDNTWAWVGPIWVSYELDASVDTTKPSGDVSGINSNYSIGNTISCTLIGEDDTDLSKLIFQIHVDGNSNPKDWDDWNVSGTWTEKYYSVSTSGWDAGNYEYFYWVEDAAGLKSNYSGSFSLLDSGDGSNDGNGDGSNDGNLPPVTQ